MTTTVDNTAYTPKFYTPTAPTNIVDHLSAIDTALAGVGGSHRVGEVITSVYTVPSYALELDGSAVSRTTYADLYAVLGDRYGNGDGSTTFDLPDYRGEFLRGCGAGQLVSGATPSNPDHASRTARADGARVGLHYPGSHEPYSIITHRHGESRSTNNRTGGGSNVCTGAGSNNNVSYAGNNESRPKNTNVLFCIVFEGH